MEDKINSTKRILVTGGTGFVGSYLLRHLLSEGYQSIRALKRSNSPMGLVDDIADQIEWVEGDLLDTFGIEDAMKGIDQVYHNAAVVSFDPRDRNRMMRVNQEGTANIVNAGLKEQIEKLLHVSSIAAIGRPLKTNYITEDTKWERSRLNSSYGISKFQAEYEVWRGMAEGLNVAVVNPSVILGSGFWTKGPQRFFNLVWKKYPLYPEGATGFVDVRDVVRFMRLLMESDRANERFILNAANISYLQLMQWIAEEFDRPVPTIKVGPILSQIAWRVEWIRGTLTGAKPMVTKETAAVAGVSIEYENQKSIDAFDFSYHPIRETIREVALQFLEASTEGFVPKILPDYRQV